MTGEPSVTPEQKNAFALTPRELTRIQGFPETLEALADWYDYDAATAESVGEIGCMKHDEKRAAELRAEAERLRKEQES